MDNDRLNAIGRAVSFFVHSKITPLVLAFAVLLGVMAIIHLPREEEPQISVPMFDIFVSFPGATAQEVEKRIINVGERKLWEIPGVEYIYSVAQQQGAVITVRFKVGEDVEKSLIKLYTKVYSNLDILPTGASQPLIKARSIDDVPIMTLTFYSPAMDPLVLRRHVAAVQETVNSIVDISQTQIIGGHKRSFEVALDPAKMSEHMVNMQELAQAIKSANVKSNAGHLETYPQVIAVESDGYFRSKKDLEELVLSSFAGRVVLLKDIAQVTDGPDTSDQKSFFQLKGQVPYEAVSLAISKRKGANASKLCQEVLKKIETLKGGLIPLELKMVVTRNYGQSASEKSDELLFHMALAIVAVSLLVAIALGWREAGIVAIAIPVTLALTLASFYSLGFTLNRITLFALIFSVGILVDDPIVNVENIVRHLRLAQNKGRKFMDIVIGAVNEVQGPLILATLTVIAAILPMAFVSGLMGPYMRPIPIGSSAAMIFSMISAFIATPWAAYKILNKPHAQGKLTPHDTKEDGMTRFYRSYMNPLIYNPNIRRNFIIAVALLLGLCLMLVPFKAVKVKMLPFDNKNEFQIVLDMPQGTSLDKTAEVLAEISSFLQTVAEVENVQSYIGTSSAYNFNGLVRHYYLRDKTWQGDLQVNLLPKDKRRRQSHQIAKSIRPMVHQIVSRYNGHVQVAEVPPGPPVLSTLVLEIFGDDNAKRRQLAAQTQGIMQAHSGITDITTYEASDEKSYKLEIDQLKASINGIPASLITSSIAEAIGGKSIDLAHLSGEYEPVEIVLRLAKDKRQALDHVLSMSLLSKTGVPVELKDLVTIKETLKEKPIYHKNLMRVSYVLGDVTGDFESPVYVIFDLDKSLKDKGLKTYWTDQPKDEGQSAVKFDGEWQITYEVFRDLGIAFGVVLVLIYVLVVGWFKSFKVPLIIMLPIPLTLIGILPAHWMTGMFFTATSMIGMIAGAGIVVRNSIILVDFIQLRINQGLSLQEAVIDAGATRFRPMLLTAMAVVIGASVILFDPIFQGLALSLMAGEIASTVLSRTAIPVVYYMMMKPKHRKEQ